MDPIALAQDKIDWPLCDGCGERAWTGDMSDDPDGRYCPGCQEIRTENDTRENDTQNESGQAP